MEETSTRAQKVEEKKHWIYIPESTLKGYILIHTEDNFSLKEVNDTIQIYSLFITFDINSSRRFLLFNIMSHSAFIIFDIIVPHTGERVGMRPN